MQNKRSVCENCKRPTKVCYCPGLPKEKLSLKADLVIFQDPREDKQAFNSVRLLERSIENVTIFKGRVFFEQQFNNPVLLYPSKNASNTLPEHVGTIILIDATWKFAKNLYNKNPWLKNLPTVVLQPVHEPIYAALRKPPKEGLISTAEALILILEFIGDLDNSNSLRSALKYAVDAEPWQKEVYEKSNNDS
ncbi:hypothetical protein SteCoe_22071 [Stentor coeruleus]|uniref:tRNA-uridine aminocarboxypropyltransferase n=1 Tax=Stentor coeruleus TaxID=5963 RepID=A0A1R2BMY2_9CILI|nr:hypothetical protein SteCoe_22071 [Stentor coeruleus]